MRTLKNGEQGWYKPPFEQSILVEITKVVDNNTIEVRYVENKFFEKTVSKKVFRTIFHKWLNWFTYEYTTDMVECIEIESEYFRRKRTKV